MKSMLAQLTSIEGKASDVRQARATIVSNGGFGAAWDNSWGTSYECLFRISEAPVALRVSSPIFIKDGETIRVVGGHNGNGVFDAVAYYNRSSGASGTSDGALFQRLFVNWVVVIVGFLALAPFTVSFMSRFFRDDHMVVDSLVAVCAVLGLPLVLVGWVMFVRYRSKIRAIEKLLNGA